ncbi:MAG: nitronate monooxygenase [Burkholderiaceae bacterium]
MFRISGPDLVIAACRNGVIGAFPTLNARTPQELDAWLQRIAAGLADAPGPVAPWAANLIIGREPQRLEGDMEVLLRHGVRVVITSVGSPAVVIPSLHATGCMVLADVATLRHAQRAVDAGADGLVLLTAGAGGQTGWLNGFAFVRAVRRFFDGPIVLAGGMSDGTALWAAETLGCDLGYMGTPFIATHESMASAEYRRMLVEASADDVQLTRAITGLPANILRPSLVAAGLDPKQLDEGITPERARELFGISRENSAAHATRWKDIWSAGHSVSGVLEITSVAERIRHIAVEYAQAREQTRARLK